MPQAVYCISSKCPGFRWEYFPLEIQCWFSTDFLQWFLIKHPFTKGLVGTSIVHSARGRDPWCHTKAGKGSGGSVIAPFH